MHLIEKFIIVVLSKKFTPSFNKYKGFQACSKSNYSNFDQIYRED